MKPIKTALCLFAAACCCASPSFADVPGVNRAKVVAFGWDTLVLSPEEILANADSFGRSGLDGVLVMVTGRKPDGTVYNARYVSKDEPWTKEMVAGTVSTLSRFRDHRGLRDSLVFGLFGSRRRLDWNDDAAWAKFANNVAVLAYIAKASGLGRLHLDNEDYVKVRQYYHDPETDGASFDAVCRMARRRGREMGRAVFGEFPEISLGFMWLLSEHRRYFTCADPLEEKRSAGDLWPDFVNGLLDVIPPTARIVDGDEHAYHADAEGHDFYRHFWNQRQGALRLVEPENRVKYLSQVSVSAGIYLDMFVNPSGSIWYFGPGADGTRTGRFAAILAEGAYVATDYIWVYGEKHAFVDWRTDLPYGKARKDKRFAKVRSEGRYTWESVIPGWRNVIRSVTDPRSLAREALAADTENLVGWNAYRSWQHPKKSKGKFFKDVDDAPEGGFSLVAKGVTQGCFIFDVPVKPGELYAVSGSVKGKGGITVTWSSKGALSVTERKYALPLDTPSAGGWMKGETALCVPPGMDRLVVHPGVSMQKPDEETRFSSVRVVKIPHR